MASEPWFCFSDDIEVKDKNVVLCYDYIDATESNTVNEITVQLLNNGSRAIYLLAVHAFIDDKFNLTNLTKVITTNSIHRVVSIYF